MGSSYNYDELLNRFLRLQDENAKLRDALKLAERAQVWYLEGPYGPSPSAEDLNLTRSLLSGEVHAEDKD